MNGAKTWDLVQPAQQATNAPLTLQHLFWTQSLARILSLQKKFAFSVCAWGANNCNARFRSVWTERSLTHIKRVYTHTTDKSPHIHSAVHEHQGNLWRNKHGHKGVLLLLPPIPQLTLVTLREDMTAHCTLHTATKDVHGRQGQLTCTPGHVSGVYAYHKALLRHLEISSLSLSGHLGFWQRKHFLSLLHLRGREELCPVHCMSCSAVTGHSRIFKEQFL